MRFTTTDRSNASSQLPSKGEISRAFSNHGMELTWLAEFLSDDSLIASVCVADARDLVGDINNDEGGQKHSQWEPVAAVVLSVLDLKFGRIAELSSAYEHFDVFSPENPPLSVELMQLMVTESHLVQSQLDCLCRFVLVLCGLARYSATETALMLGVSTRAVEAAYARALETMEIMYCQAVLDSCDCAAA